MRTTAIGVLSLALVGCASVGPNYQAPPVPVPPARFESAASPLYTGNEPPGQWWTLFGQPAVDREIRLALAANTDLRVAGANVARARAVLREARAGRLPSTDVSASATYANQPGPGGADTVYDLGLDIGYQLDLFGRIRRAVEASRADLEAVQAAFDVSRITVAAETARAFADACGSGAQIDAARNNLRVQAETFDLTRRRVAGGRGTDLDTNQAASLLEQTRATIPTLEAERRAALYRLAVLTGRPPADYPPEAARCVEPLTVAVPLPVGNGASLLARRPDVRQAERQLAAATARIGVATAELYPDIRIGGSLGSTATSPGDLFSSDGFRFGIGPLISWTFPNISVARARIAQSEAEAQAALARFDAAWLNALRETETALARHAGALERVQALIRARDASAEAARIARLRYRAGREDFQIVLEAERASSQTETALAEARARLSDSFISLFLALGGGWNG